MFFNVYGVVKEDGQVIIDVVFAIDADNAGRQVSSWYAGTSKERA